MHTNDGTHIADSPTQANANPPKGVQLSREQILRVTARSLLEHGYDATTIRRIASMLDCAVGSIYRYFRDKRALLSAVTQQSLEPVADLVEAGGAGDDGAAGVFEESVRQYYQRAVAAPEVYRLMFWLACVGKVSPNSPDAQRLPRVVRRVIEGWSRLLGSPERAVRCWSLLHGAIMLGEDQEAAIAAVTGAAAHGDRLGSEQASDRGLDAPTRINHHDTVSA